MTGPTGSGKTTTLYGALNELNRPDRKIITAEDPVEYNFVGINQCQVRENIGLTFAKILRAMLRQAPNIILVGEIRDLEVAEVAIQAALTGHLVFTHAAHQRRARRDHASDRHGREAVPGRHLDPGGDGPAADPRAVPQVQAAGPRAGRDVAASSRGITEEDLKDKTLYKPRGCDYCTGTGFRGRIGIFEMMIMNNEIRDAGVRARRRRTRSARPPSPAA